MKEKFIRLGTIILLLSYTYPAFAQTGDPVTSIENGDGESVLQSFDDGGLLLPGEFGTGAIPMEGEGTRLVWHPSKAAFRAGYVDNDQWNDANIGNYSTAMGFNTTASGAKSMAFGNYASAVGNSSTAMGGDVIASGDGSIAMGISTNAVGNRSTAIGYNTFGEGLGSTALGYETRASGIASTALGDGTVASGGQSTAMGLTTTASGDISTALGLDTVAKGNRSTAMGFQIVAATANSLSVGQYNNSNQSDDGSLFVVGNGNSTERSDALVLDSDGNLSISGNYNQHSDRRLKKDIQPISEAVLEKIGQIQPVRYQFKNQQTHPSGPQIGLIAQVVQKQFPELIQNGSDGYLSISYSKFVPILLKGMQEQQTQFEILKNENKMIKKRLARLEQKNQHASLIPGMDRITGLVLLTIVLIGTLTLRIKTR